MTHTVTSEIFKWSALWCILCQSRRACAVLWKGLVLLGNTLCDPMKDVWHRQYVQVLFQKGKGLQTTPKLCAKPIPLYHTEQDTSTHGIVSWMREASPQPLCRVWMMQNPGRVTHTLWQPGWGQDITWGEVPALLIPSHPSTAPAAQPAHRRVLLLCHS